MHSLKYTAYVIYQRHKVVMHPQDSIKKLEYWLISTLKVFSGKLGFIIDNESGKVVLKHKRII